MIQAWNCRFVRVLSFRTGFLWAGGPRGRDFSKPRLWPLGVRIGGSPDKTPPSGGAFCLTRNSAGFPPRPFPGEHPENRIIPCFLERVFPLPGHDFRGPKGVLSVVMDLSTLFMGLGMPNPLIVSSSGLSASVEGVKKAVEAGAGAVVLKSLFEEDIAAAVEQTKSGMSESHPEAESYLRQMGMLLEPDEYLGFVENSVRLVDVPIIASLNCHSANWWVDYARRIEKVGADAIELNIAPLPTDPKLGSAKLEDDLVALVGLARREVKIPIAVKIGQHFSALPHLAARLHQVGADGLTLFNRYYRLDIDIEGLEFKPGDRLSAREEFAPVLRSIGIISSLTNLDISASTGVHGSSDVIKTLLVGGDTAQLCSVLYREGLGVVAKIKENLENWMGRHDYSTIADFRGLLSFRKRGAHYRRLQYVKALK